MKEIRVTSNETHFRKWGKKVINCLEQRIVTIECDIDFVVYQLTLLLLLLLMMLL